MDRRNLLRKPKKLATKSKEQVSTFDNVQQKLTNN